MTSSHTYPATSPPRSANRGATRTAVILLGLLAAFNGADHGSAPSPKAPEHRRASSTSHGRMSTPSTRSTANQRSP
jgi:hypothetical protein